MESVWPFGPSYIVRWYIRLDSHTVIGSWLSVLHYYDSEGSFSYEGTLLTITCIRSDSAFTQSLDCSLFALNAQNCRDLLPRQTRRRSVASDLVFQPFGTRERLHLF